MRAQLPKTPANMNAAQEGEAALMKELRKMNIYTFKWPQDMDSGIDLVGFATLFDEKEPNATGAATAFVAGFQSKGTDDHFTVENRRSVPIGLHRDYWSTAGLPVFVTKVSNDGAALLVEDASSFLLENDTERQSIPTTVSIASAEADIRLRM
ncbi:hypothetical protein, partial [Arthrobacter gyeryongensis]|uniref:hypothetical protein n=1 Tax=Arthrobacter gyeryongensis TaxID=1650592 RepID=UPI0031EF0DD6